MKNTQLFQPYERTLFFLGAGASFTYGFPVGSELVIQICDDIRCKQPLFEILTNRLGVDEGRLGRFAEAFIDARHSTIDQFLETRGDLKDIGRLAVAIKLIEYENHYKVKGARGDWLSVYLSRLLEGASDYWSATDAVRLVQFYTLNYDRSVEYLLFSLLKARYVREDLVEEIPDESIVDFVNSRVFHVHGQLGKLSGKESEKGRPYIKEFPVEAEYFKKSCQLKFWDDGSNLPRNSRYLNLACESANQIFILGFGFHEGIINRFEQGCFSEKKVYLSNFGIGNREWERAVRWVSPGIAATDLPPVETNLVKNAYFGGTSIDCDNLLKKVIGS